MLVIVIVTVISSDKAPSDTVSFIEAVEFESTSGATIVTVGLFSLLSVKEGPLTCSQLYVRGSPSGSVAVALTVVDPDSANETEVLAETVGALFTFSTNIEILLLSVAMPSLTST